MKISGKYIAVTGCNRGIGLAFLKAAARLKTHLIIINRSGDIELEKQLLELGAISVESIACDLSQANQVSELVKILQSKQIDILFNNAGLLTGGLFEDQNWNDIEKMLSVNVNALIRLTHAILPQMLKQKSGKIINHGSVSSIMHFPCATTYSASKAAVWALTDCLEQELKNTGVSTLCLLTPGIKTRMFDQITDLYSKNLEVPKDSISPDDYAMKIIDAIKTDQPVLWPEGKTAAGLFLAQHFRSVFNWGTRKVFNR